MKPRSSNQRNHALTLLEVVVVISILALIAALLLPALATAKHKHSRIGRVNYLKEINLACRVWEGDNDDKYPMKVSVTNGGSMELVLTGNVLATFMVMSNELSTPKILHCPEDTEHIEATSFAMLASSNISYFISADVTNDAAPQSILSGDDNFVIGGVPVKSGLLEFSTNAPISWTAARHKFVGNLAMADGSVQQVTQNGLRQTVRQTGVATNRLAIP
jgi:prepilin-type N-terminal cleavage/methylation domain-containing protein/prepilin-type processing-associated H-X9-DG protein